MSVVRSLYSLLMWLAQPLLRRKLARRGAAEPVYLQAVQERFGYYDAPLDTGFIWLHAVSLGETRTAAILIKQLRQRLPGMRLLLTNGTATGRAEGAGLLQPGDVQVWQPWDTPGAVQRFLQHFKPRIGVLLETEVWPNLAAACRQAGVPLVLANARLSEKSLRNALRLAWIAKPAYQSLAAVWAQTEIGAQRLRQLGAPVSAVFGNLKFDAAPDAAQIAQGKAWRAACGRPVILLASSREGEEARFLQLLQSFRAAAKAEPADEATKSIVDEVQWLIVPRHPQRFDEVAALIERHGLGVSRRSAWALQPQAGDVWLGDSLGEMALYYGLADVALLGGSFEPLGGQNLIEAAACGCPVVMGPSTFNFAQAARLAEAAGAASRADSMEAALQTALALTRDAPGRAAMAERGTGFAAAHRGAVDKTAAAVVALLGS
ncbi:3-deoxy-D-manno-octulosonic acid transferase [Polaromonas sp. C04]|uniref:3-deoxy-D-manno-octulosonic acid transferase n=1 Tax=Polaromonas sp. C04 TaxID=1945857 RepID=UPI0025711312|nr:3-deoxy-D-manno-octulosonic acid transferase [Polaromonas sp. C04]